MSADPFSFFRPLKHPIIFIRLQARFSGIPYPADLPFSFRYNYFTFDPDSRSFVCPLCRDCCNCSVCMRKRNLAHLLQPGKTGIRTKSLQINVKEQGKGDMTVQAWIDKAIEDRVGAPFDRVRLVAQATDVVSPDMPEEEVIVVVRPARKTQRSKKHALARAEEGESQRLVVKLKAPKSNDSLHRTEKVKEVDSDGDTVAGWSDEETGGIEQTTAQSSLTSISNSPSPVPARFAFPTRPSLALHSTNDYLSSIAGPGYMLPADGPYRLDSLDSTMPVPLDGDAHSPHMNPLTTPQSNTNHHVTVPRHALHADDLLYQSYPSKSSPKVKRLPAEDPLCLAEPHRPEQISSAWQSNRVHFNHESHHHLMPSYAYEDYTSSYSPASMFGPSTGYGTAIQTPIAPTPELS